MPTYEYKCPKCGTQFELFQKMSAKAVARCPKCGAMADRQLSGGGGLVFKGTGFYITDYKRAGEKRDGETKSPDAKAAEPSKPKKKEE